MRHEYSISCLHTQFCEWTDHCYDGIFPVWSVQKAAVVLMDEEHSKAEGRGEMSETELLIMDQFTILVRDLYAFYPLLIRFVDYNRYSAPAQRLHFLLDDS